MAAEPSGKKRSWLAPVVGITAGLFIIAAFNFQLVTTWVHFWVTPSAAISNSSIDDDSTLPVYKDPRIVIPKINVDAPTVMGMNSTVEADVQKALEGGVLHFAGTPLPGQAGNSVFVGHSSNDVWKPGDYKFVFALLEKMEVGERIYLYNDGVRYTYRISEKYVVSPNDTKPLSPSQKPIVTLITCTPVGTAWNRLIVVAEQISPDPSTAKPASTSSGTTRSLPGD